VHSRRAFRACSRCGFAMVTVALEIDSCFTGDPVEEALLYVS
jgi:hypothetical protein